MFLGMVKETSKDKKWPKGSKESAEGQGKAIQVWFTWSSKISYNNNLYYKVEDGNPVMLLLYVDDLFVIGMDGLITDMKRNIVAKLKIKDLGMMHYF